MKYPDLGGLIKVSVDPLGNMPEQLYVVLNWTTEEFLGTVYHVEPFVEGGSYQGETGFVPQSWFDNGWATVVENVEEKEDLVGRVVFIRDSLNTGLFGDFYVIETWHEKDVWEAREVGGSGVSYWVSEKWLEKGWVELLEGDED